MSADTDVLTVTRSPFAQHMLETWTRLAAEHRLHGDDTLADRCQGWADTWLYGGERIRWEIEP